MGFFQLEEGHVSKTVEYCYKSPILNFFQTLLFTIFSSSTESTDFKNKLAHSFTHTDTVVNKSLILV
jgi:hypothetical protein